MHAQRKRKRVLGGRENRSSLKPGQKIHHEETITQTPCPKTIATVTRSRQNRFPRRHIEKTPTREGKREIFRGKRENEAFKCEKAVGRAVFGGNGRKVGKPERSRPFRIRLLSNQHAKRSQGPRDARGGPASWRPRKS